MIKHKKFKNLLSYSFLIHAVLIVFCLTFVNFPSTAQESKAKAPGRLFQKGKACHYADKFKGRRTSSGEKYHPNKFTAAHKTLPLGTKVLVKNLENDKSVVVTINDRGPFTKLFVIDLSKSAAKKLGTFKNSKNKVAIYQLNPDASNIKDEQIASQQNLPPHFVPEPEDDFVQSVWFSKIIVENKAN